MRIYTPLFIICSLFFFACQQTKKEKEVKVEVKMDATETGTKATVTITTDDNGRISEEIQVFEGTQEEVSEKVKTKIAEVAIVFGPVLTITLVEALRVSRIKYPPAFVVAEK